MVLHRSTIPTALQTLTQMDYHDFSISRNSNSHVPLANIKAVKRVDKYNQGLHNNNDPKQDLVDLSAVHESIKCYLDDLTTFQRWFETTTESLREDIILLRKAEVIVKRFEIADGKRSYTALFLAYLCSRFSVNVRNSVGVSPRENVTYETTESETSRVMLVKPLIQLLDFTACQLLFASYNRPAPRSIEQISFYDHTKSEEIRQLMTLFRVCDDVEKFAATIPDDSYPKDTCDVDLSLMKTFDALVAAADHDTYGITDNHRLYPCCVFTLTKDPHLIASKVLERFVDITFQIEWNVFHQEFSITVHDLNYLEKLIANKQDKATYAELANDKTLLSVMQDLQKTYCKYVNKIDDIILICYTKIFEQCKGLLHKIERACTCRQPLHIKKHCYGGL